MGRLDGVDDAGRAVAGLLGYNPGPGIYSRLERAVEAMPANVRVQELPGLLKRYKEGVPGWELKETDFPGLVGDAKVIPRQDLLDRVRERSPVFTHGEVVQGGRPQMQEVSEGTDWLSSTTVRPDYQFPDTGQVSRLGRGVSHGPPQYKDYGQGGQDYTELLLVQPHVGGDYGSHWAANTKDAVAHARFDTHGDALRINELQSDLGIFNRRAREDGATPGPMNFPLEDAWSDILIKRLALEAARQGHRAIEVASPRAIADKVGGNIDNYEHFYGKVVPGAIERLGRKMGGVTDVTPGPVPEAAPGYEAVLDAMRDGPPAEGQLALRDAIEALRMIRNASPPGPRGAFAEAPGVAWNKLAAAYGGDGNIEEQAHLLHGMLGVDLGRGGGNAARAGEMMPQLVRLAENHAAAMDRYRRVSDLADAQRAAQRLPGGSAAPPGRRYIMSDEMRRRLIEQGVGASVLAPLLMQGEE